MKAGKAMLVKICGIRDELMLETVIEAGADLVGLVFHPASPRYTPIHVAAHLARQARGRIGIVGLCVAPSREELRDIADLVAPDWLQMHRPAIEASAPPGLPAAHGADPALTLASIREDYGIPILESASVASPEDLALVQLRAATDPSLMLLLDAKAQAGAPPGGNGVAFDWTILAGFRAPRPWLLAGGLKPDNVAQAILTARGRLSEQDRAHGIAPNRFAGVDVSSGVESARGIKDPDLIHAFVRAARDAWRA